MSGVHHHGQNPPMEGGLVGGRMGGRDIKERKAFPGRGWQAPCPPWRKALSLL